MNKDGQFVAKDSKEKLLKFLKSGKLQWFVSQGLVYIRSNRSDLKFRLNLARIAARLGKSRTAIHQYESLCNEFPASSEVFVDFGRYAYFILQDYVQAQQLFSSAIAVNDDLPVWVYYLAGKRKPYYVRVADDLVYSPIPKNGSTSIKYFIVDKLKGVDVDKRGPHGAFPNAFNEPGVSARESDKKIVVLRDPIKRLISYHQKNIVEAASLEKEAKLYGGESFGLNLRPNFDEFTERLFEYCFHFNDVLHHILPQAAYVDDIKSYEYIYSNEEIDDAIATIAKTIGIDSWVAPRKMVGKAKKAMQIDKKKLLALNTLYSDDYKILHEVPSWSFSKYCLKMPSFASLLSPVDRTLTPLAVTGHIDTLAQACLHGWAWDGVSDESCLVEIFLDKRKIGSCSADGLRADLLAQGIGNGHHGFEFALPAAVFDGLLHVLHAGVRVDGKLVQLKGSGLEVLLAPADAIAGAVTLEPGGLLQGWVRDARAPAQGCMLRVDIDGHTVAQVLADGAGPDEPGLGAEGHGFQVVLPNSWCDGQQHRVRVLEAGTGKCLHAGDLLWETARASHGHDVRV